MEISPGTDPEILRSKQAQISSRQRLSTNRTCFHGFWQTPAMSSNIYHQKTLAAALNRSTPLRSPTDQRNWGTANCLAARMEAVSKIGRSTACNSVGGSR